MAAIDLKIDAVAGEASHIDLRIFERKIVQDIEAQAFPINLTDDVALSEVIIFNLRTLEGSKGIKISLRIFSSAIVTRQLMKEG